MQEGRASFSENTMRPSTGKPTKEEAARIVASKEGPCMACLVGYRNGLAFPSPPPQDYHHTLSGSRRRGHMFGFALCPWHHRGISDENFSATYLRKHCGPSLMDGTKLFREAYGTDQELIDLQTITIEGEF